MTRTTTIKMSSKRELPHRGNTPDLDVIAWLGDALFLSDVRYTYAKTYGKVEEHKEKAISSAAAMRGVLEELGFSWPPSLSDHSVAQAFEYLYYTDPKFRDAIRKWHHLDVFQLDIEPAAQLALPSADEPGQCWRRLFAGSVSSHEQWAHNGYLSRKQLAELVKTNPLAEGHYDLTTHGNNWHVVYGTAMTAQEVIASMTNRARLGASGRGYDIPWGRIIDWRLTNRTGKMVLKPVLKRKCCRCGEVGQYNVNKSAGQMIIVNYKDQLYCRRCRKAEVELEEFHEMYSWRSHCGYMYCEEEHGEQGCKYLKVDPAFDYFSDKPFPVIGDSSAGPAEAISEVVTTSESVEPMVAEVPALVFGEDTSSSDESDEEAIAAITSMRFHHPLRLGDFGGKRFKLPAFNIYCDDDPQPLHPVVAPVKCARPVLKKVPRSMVASKPIKISAPSSIVNATPHPALGEESLGCLDFSAGVIRCGPGWTHRGQMHSPTADDWLRYKGTRDRIKKETMYRLPSIKTVPSHLKKKPMESIGVLSDYLAKVCNQGKLTIGPRGFIYLAKTYKQVFKCPQTYGVKVIWKRLKGIILEPDHEKSGIGFYLGDRLVCHCGSNVADAMPMISKMPRCGIHWCDEMKTRLVVKLRESCGAGRELPVDSIAGGATPFLIVEPGFTDRLMGRKFLFYVAGVKVWCFSNRFQLFDRESGYRYNTGSKAIWSHGRPMHLTWAGLSRLARERGVMAGRFWAPWELISKQLAGGMGSLDALSKIPYGDHLPDFTWSTHHSPFHQKAAWYDKKNLASELNGIIACTNPSLPRKLDLVDGRPEPNPGPNPAIDLEPPTPVTPGGMDTDDTYKPTAAEVLSNVSHDSGFSRPYLDQYLSTKNANYHELVRIQSKMYRPEGGQPLTVQRMDFQEAHLRKIRMVHRWRYQSALDCLPTVPRVDVSTYSQIIEHTAKDLACANDESSIVSLVYSLKALNGCPRAGMVYVWVDVDNSTLYIAENMLSDDGAAYFFYGDTPIGHAGPKDFLFGSTNSLPTASPGHSRSGSVSSQHSSQSKVSRAVGALKREVRDDHTIAQVLRIDGSTHSVSKEGANEYILSIGKRETIEEVFLALSSGRYRPHEPTRTSYLLQHDETLTPMPVRDAIKNRAPPQNYPMHLLRKLDNVTWVPKDKHMTAEDGWNILKTVTAVLNLQPTQEDMYLLLLSWKMVHGCPRAFDLLLWVTPGKHIEMQALVASRDDGNGGFYIFFDGHLLGHAAKEPAQLPLEVLYPFPDGSQKIVRIQSPLDLELTAPRWESNIVDDYVQVEPRHKEQDPELRLGNHDGIHHLPSNYLDVFTGDLLDTIDNPWEQEVADIVHWCFAMTESWAREVGQRQLIVTANLIWQPSPDQYVVNLVTNRFGLKKRELTAPNVLTLQVPLNGRALRTLRIYYLFLKSTYLEYVNVTNGNADLWDHVGHGKPPKGLEWVNFSHSFYIMHMTCCNVFLRTGQLPGEAWWRYFLLTMTIYGSDELPFARLPCVYQVCAPRWGLRRHPILAIPRNLRHPCDTTFLNVRGQKVAHLTQLTLERCTELIFELFPGRLRVEAGQIEGARYVSFREALASTLVVTDDVWLLHKFARWAPWWYAEKSDDAINWLSEYGYPIDYRDVDEYGTQSFGWNGNPEAFRDKWIDSLKPEAHSSRANSEKRGFFPIDAPGRGLFPLDDTPEEQEEFLDMFRDINRETKVYNHEMNKAYYRSQVRAEQECQNTWASFLTRFIIIVFFPHTTIMAVSFWCSMYWEYLATGYLWPTFDPHIPSTAVSCSEEVFPANYDSTMYNQLLNIRTFGSEGDNRPLDYLARVVARAGLLVHITKTVDDNSILGDLEKGNLFRWIPGYASILFAGKEGYKAVLQPHADVYGKGSTYTMAPPREYVHETRFVSADRFQSMPVLKKVVTYLADTWSETFKADLQIGNLRGCSVPRGMSSGSALEKRPNLNTGKVGWTSGSAHPSVIPLEIREAFEEVPRGDHITIFPRYSKIYCHGGAGTMQTGLACGVEMISCDQTLDRNYKRALIATDYSHPTCLALYGMLLSHGFVTKLPAVLKPPAMIAWFWATRAKWLTRFILAILRLLVLTAGLVKHGSTAIVIAISCPPIAATLAKRWGMWQWLTDMIRVLWYCPLILWVDWRLALFLSFINSDGWFVYLLQDIRAFSDSDFHLVYEPIEDNHHLRFPWGHWSLEDHKEDYIYEGRFVNRGEKGLGKNFRFMKLRRRVHAKAKRFPVPLRIHTVARYLMTAETKPYAADWNCMTMIAGLLQSNSLIMHLWFRMVTFSVVLALAPAEWFAKIYHSLRGEDFYDTRLARDLGFAAAHEGDVPELEGIGWTSDDRIEVVYGDDELPYFNLSPLDIQTETVTTTRSERYTQDPLFTLSKQAVDDPDSYHNLVKEIASLTAVLIDAATDEEQEVVKEAALTTLADAMVHAETPLDNATQVHEEVKRYEPMPYQQAIDAVKSLLDKIRGIPSVQVFLMWIDGVKTNLHEFFLPMLRFLSWALESLYKLSQHYYKKMLVAVARLIDSYWPEPDSKRIKTVWGPTGLFKGAISSAKRELELSIAMSEFKGRHTMPRDYDRLVNDLKVAAANHPVAKNFVDEIGGDQYRQVRIGIPVMSRNEAAINGLKDGEWTDIPSYDRQIQSLLDSGVKQGTDGVIYASSHQELLDRANERYEPTSQKVLPAELETLAAEVADALYNKYPEAHANADIITPQSVLRYMQVKGKMPYSAGVPFIGSNKLKSRQKLLESGMMDVIMQEAMRYLKSGEMPVDFYHTFGKSQVVDAETLISKSKLRTVTSTGLLHTFIENMFQHALNKRPTWRTTGIGSGMPLNQNMVYLWERMAEKFDTYGGMFIEKDCTAFDSGIQQFGFRIEEHLTRKGFENHPSGNGEAFASVMKAKYDAMQDAHLFKITQDPRPNVVIGAPQHNMYNHLISLGLPNVVGIDDVSPEDLVPGQILVVRHPNQCPPTLSWNGMFTFGNKEHFDARRHQFGHYVYDHADFRSVTSDFTHLAAYDMNLLARHQLKDQGGATGQTSTTKTNTWVDKGVVVAAWTWVTRERFPDTAPDEFWDYNEYYNQSDDAMWLTYGVKGLRQKDMYLFQRLCHYLGSDLKLNFTREISNAEYLSKFVRTPTPHDSEDLRVWKIEKIKAIQATLSLTKRERDEEIADIVRRAHPRFVVYQNIAAAKMRATALRYYQASPRADRYIIAMLQRAAGHSQLTAFCPSFYDELAHQYCELVNSLLQRHSIFQKYQVSLDQYGRQQVLQVNPRWKEQVLSPRQMSILRILREHPFPSYLKVLKTHMEIKTGDDAAYEKLMRKIGKGVYTPDEVFKQIVDSFWKFTDNIPDEFSKKFMPTVDFIYPDNPFYTKNEIAGRHALWSLLDEFSEDEIDYPMFQNRVSEGPYSAIADTVRTWENWKNPKWRQEFYEAGPEQAWCQALTISLVYIIMIMAEKWIYRLSYIGPIYSFFFWTFIGVPKIYGILNTLYWHGTGKSSVIISQLMPRDPYIFQKRIVGITCDLIPAVLSLALLPIMFVIRESSLAFETTSKVIRKQLALRSPPVENTGPANPWAPHVLECVEMLNTSSHKRIYVDAPTSTGKSTMFPSAILSQRQHHGYSRIWLVFPYEVLRDSWSSPYGHKVQILKRGVKLEQDTQICLLTYGHFANARVSEVRDNQDLVLFDEFHLLTGEIVLSFTSYRGPALLMSATKIPLEEKLGWTVGSIPTFKPPIQRRFETHVEKVQCKQNAKPDVIELWMRMEKSQIRKDLGVTMDRVIVIVPTINEVKRTITALHNLGVIATEVSRRQRVIPDKGHLVCTQIVDAGINIEGATCLVDLGTCIEIHRGKKVKGHPWTDPARNKQRIGRVGRFTTGYCIQPEWAGTGELTESYPAASYFQHKAVARFYGLDPLGVVESPADPRVPFLSIRKEGLSKQQYNSVLCYYLLIMSGCDRDATQAIYHRLARKIYPGDNFEWVWSICNRQGVLKTPLIPFDQLNTVLSMPNISKVAVDHPEAPYQIRNDPIIPLEGRWARHSAIADNLAESLDRTEAPRRPRKKGKAPENNVEALSRNVHGLVDKVNQIITTVSDLALEHPEHYTAVEQLRTITGNLLDLNRDL
nr:polyprotein [Trichoderma harzianum hypovirus 2]